MLRERGQTLALRDLHPGAVLLLHVLAAERAESRRALALPLPALDARGYVVGTLSATVDAAGR